ncbi:MAG: response regulator transcription factor [Acidobacteria bacterium]|nr:response regulator transcription factor [Acidobacteriota bacterium]
MGIRILIADRLDMHREILRHLLEAQPDFEVVGDTGDGEQLVRMVAQRKPDILLIDLNLRRLFGLEALRKIAELKLEVRPILLPDVLENNEIIQALVVGARGVVYKRESTQTLFKSIRTIMAGEYWLSNEGVSELVRNLQSLAAQVEQHTRIRANGLSRHQQKIVEAIMAGCSNKEIAQDLSVSERTVKYHLTRIFGKMGVSGRMQLARLSLKTDATDLPQA